MSPELEAADARQNRWGTESGAETPVTGSPTDSASTELMTAAMESTGGGVLTEESESPSPR
jgi:hypothetical protein